MERKWKEWQKSSCNYKPLEVPGDNAVGMINCGNMWARRKGRLDGTQRQLVIDRLNQARQWGW